MSWSTTIEQAIHAWIVSGSGLAGDHVIWDDQGGDRPSVPYISIQLSSLGTVGQDWLEVEDNPLVIADDDVESVNTGANTLTLTAHGLLKGDGPVQLTTSGTLPAGLALATDYWVIWVDDDTISLASTFLLAMAETAINLTTVGTGTHTVSDTSETERVGEEITHIAQGQRLGELSIQCFAVDATGTARAVAILNNVLSSIRLPTPSSALQSAGIGVSILAPVVPISGVLGAGQWEPRASTSVQFFLANEVSEETNYIERAVVTRQL